MDSSDTDATSSDPDSGFVSFGNPVVTGTDTIDALGPSADSAAFENGLFQCSAPFQPDVPVWPALQDTTTGIFADVVDKGQASETSCSHQEISPPYQRSVEHPINPLELTETSTNDSFLTFNDSIPDHALSRLLFPPLQTEPNSVSYIQNAGSVADPADTNPAPLLPPISKNPRKRRSVEEWKAMRPIIENLRMREKKNLAEIMKILADKYSFSPSRTAYKNQFRIWRLGINLNKRKAHKMLQRQEQRKVEKGKETSFRYKGVEVSKAKLERYKKARAAADTSCSTMSTLSDLSFWTPGSASLVGDMSVRSSKIGVCANDQGDNVPWHGDPRIEQVFPNKLDDRMHDGDSRTKRFFLDGLGFDCLDGNSDFQQIYLECHEGVQPELRAKHLFLNKLNATICDSSNLRAVNSNALKYFRSICESIEPPLFMDQVLDGPQMQSLDECAGGPFQIFFSDCGLPVMLAILLCRAATLVELDKLTYLEVSLDRLLRLAEGLELKDPSIFFTIVLPAVKLLLGVHSGNRNYWHMEKLLVVALHEWEDLPSTAFNDTILDLQKLLLMIKMCDFNCRNLEFRGFVFNRVNELPVRELLSKIPDSNKDARFCIGLLDYLRKTYTVERRINQLEPILGRLERLLELSEELGLWEPFMSYACIGLIQCYCYLNRSQDAMRCLDSFSSKICKTPIVDSVKVPNLRELARTPGRSLTILSNGRLPWRLVTRRSRTTLTASDLLAELKKFEVSEPNSDFLLRETFTGHCLTREWGLAMPWEA